MTSALPQDTPIARATIKDMTDEQLDAHIKLLQERRMRSYTLFQEAQAIKAKLKDEKDKAQLDKRLEQMEKLFKSVDTGLDKLLKYHNEIKVLRMTLGEY